MCGVVGCGLAPGIAPLQRCFVSGGLSVFLGLRRGGRTGGISFGFALSVSGRDRVAPPVLRQFAALVLGGIRLGMTILGSRWFVELEVPPSWFGVCWWILLPRQWVVCWSTQVVGARAQWPTRVRSSVRFKEWSSMPLHCYVLSKLEAYRLGLCPCSFFVIALASDGSNITNFSLSVPDSFGRLVDGLGVWSTEYGGCSPFCSDRHPVQVVSGPNKCSVLLLRVGKVAAVAVCSCRLVLRSFRRVVLRWAIIFKSGFIEEAKIIGF
ncbi:hypothetical protein F2Q69_00008924 [Brassica cretica]|uniref:Uncharacterized protein n=1 Tax=Brassica cretica TaxID=69181 RepID=A0A8S9P3R7_BRACR|nr:hypothetical protein F2Q69_00008924 [Brassica cretica]